MTITNTSNTADNSTLFLNDVESLTTGVVDGRTLVFAAGGDDDGLSVFELNADGTLTNLFNLADAPALQIGSLREIQFVEVDGNPLLVTAGESDAVTVFSVADDGTLSVTALEEDDGSVLLGNIDALTTIEVGGTTFVVVGNKDGNSSEEGVSVFELDSAGNLTPTDSIADSSNSALMLDEVRAMVGAQSGGNSFVIAGSTGDDGLSVFQIDSSGNLTNTYNIEDGASPDLGGEDLFLKGVRAMATTEIGGKTFIYAGGSSDDGVSVFELKSDGTLENTFNLEDGGVHELDNIRSLEIATGPAGTQFLFAVGDNIDALQVYTVNTDGSLTFFETFDDTGSTFLKNAEDITWSVVDGKLQVLAGGDENGISAFTIPCFVAGTPILTETGPRPVESIRAGDLIVTEGGELKPVRFVALRRLSASEIARAPHLAPITIRAHAFGQGHPAQDISISPQHRVLVSGFQVDLDFGLPAALAPAKGLVDGVRIQETDGKSGVTYVHLCFDGHEILQTAGLRSESYFPGPEAIRGLGGALRSELLELFPSLQYEDLSGFDPARPFLRPLETALLDLSHCRN